MVSSYTTRNRFEKPGAGDYNNTWATPANTNYDLIDQAISGVVSVDCSLGDVILTATNGALDQARNAIIVLRGTPPSQTRVFLPNQPKVFSVRSKTGGSFWVSVHNAIIGTGVTAASGEAFSAISDGTNCRKTGAVPKKTIMFWPGTTANIPPGWVLYSEAGSNFIKAGTSVGSNAAVPGSVTVNSAGSHNHTGFTGLHALTTDQIPSHTHSYTAPTATTLVGTNLENTSVVQFGEATTTGATGGGQGHNHIIGTDGAHSHTATVSSPGEPASFTLIPIQKVT